MVKYSRAQLTALARIKFNGLIYFHSGEFPMTYLDTPIGFVARINSATVRRLESDQLIEPDPGAEEGISRWRISPAGEALLGQHREYLPPAGRERAFIEGQHAITLMGTVARRAGRKVQG